MSLDTHPNSEPCKPSTGELPIAAGPFQPTWESLALYNPPEWFRDAKFGIWAHWNAQCVADTGDWYARFMYMSRDPATGRPHAHYTQHVARYGHPSQFGFKDIENIWHAENWDPEKLITLYKNAGAQYFVALANHHDNLDCYDSDHQPWNSLRIGPKCDIVGIWAKAARAANLRFGVSVHASHAWSWYETAQGSDHDGPLAGVPYDGNLTQEDGKGQWWEGLDPQDLYAQNHKPGTDFDWYWNEDKGSSVPDRAYCEKFFNRTVDLIDKYQPDLLYFDDSPLPLWPVSDVGLRLTAHFYNSNIRWHGGKIEGVVNGKNLTKEQEKCIVRDIERGKLEQIEPSVWQTDTCIGDWHYASRFFRDHSYKKASDIIPLLADVVSKNGNLLLNIPMRGDGSIDDDEIAFLEDMAKWMSVNQAGIFATRPWKIAGEGPSMTADNGKGYSEGQSDVAKTPFCAQDIRFTASKDGKTLYAIALGWPEDRILTIKSLPTNSPHYPSEIGAVELIGSGGHLPFIRDESGLTITLPEQRPCEHAYICKIAAK